MKDRLLTLIGPLLGALVFALALWVLHREFAQYHVRDLLAHWQDISAAQLALALGLTALSYWALTGYDALAFRFIQNPLPYRRIALTAFIAYAFSQSAGVSFLSGSAVRYRLYLRWRVPAGAIARAIAFNVGTFWLGFMAAGGIAWTLDPLRLPDRSWIPLSSSRPLGIAMLALLAGCAALSAASGRTPLREAESADRGPLLPRRMHRSSRAPARPAAAGSGFGIPPPRLLGAQLLLSALEWTLAAGALYALLPASPELSFARFVGAYLLAVALGLASHVPAGLGVFETAMVVLLAPAVPGDAVLGALVAYRIVYYGIPLAAAVLLLAQFEALARHRHLARVHEWIVRWFSSIVPRLFAASVLAAGVILLFSGATPAVPGRMEALARLLPLPVLEVSHFLGSAIGVSLLVLARALLQRSDAAYLLALGLLGAGMATSLLKGFDYEEAAILLAMTCALLPCHSFFNRKSSLLGQPLSVPWVLAILGVLAATVFVTLIAYQDVAYSSELWWQFEVSAQASRSLRALLGGLGALACWGLLRLLGPAPASLRLPSREQLEQLRPVVAASPRTTAHLALLGDKYLLLHERGSAFLMYGVERHSFVSMGDPIGPAAEREELVWSFRELADRHGGRTVFYQVGAQDLPIYVDLGLSLHKLGEEARVPLADFSLAGRHRKSVRQSHNRMVREGCSFEIVAPGATAPLLDELEAISSAWLAEKRASEKRFSLGFFDRAYLAQLPLAVVRQQDRIAAFANVWLGGNREELSVDLMRHAGKAGKALPGVMEFLFAELMLWGAAQGYRWFNLGMAPLAGLPRHRLAPLWLRFGAFLYQRGEPFYGFQGLRDFKDKFDPVWEPRFLASPGGLAVPVVLAHIAALVSGRLVAVGSK